MATVVAVSSPAHSLAFHAQETRTGSGTLLDFSKQLGQSDVDRSQVLQEYLVSEDERPTISYDEWTDPANIPLIDLSKNREGLANTIRDAAAEWGFFQVINHGLSLETLREVQTQGLKFFQLPAKVKQNLGPRTYTGDSTANKQSSLHWAEALFLREEEFSEKTIRKVWPDGNAEFRDTITKFISAMKIVKQHLFELLAEGLGLKTNFFTDHLNLLALRWNFYPACHLPSAVLGAMSHTDYSCFTILQQDQVGGLQILKDGQWLGIKPIEGALVVIVGDQLHAWTNARCKSVNHRVVVNKSAQRLSLGAFCSVDWDFSISAPEELVDEKHPRLYRPLHPQNICNTSLPSEK